MERNYLAIGDTVLVHSELAHLSHPDNRSSQQAVVVGFYPNFFNVQYPLGYQQSIMYRDMKMVKILKTREECIA